MTKKSSHGGNIYQMARRLGIPESEVLDFSANINPIGLPDFIREAVVSSIDGIVNYPDPDCTALREEISRRDRKRKRSRSRSHHKSVDHRYPLFRC